MNEQMPKNNLHELIQLYKGDLKKLGYSEKEAEKTVIKAFRLAAIEQAMPRDDAHRLISYVASITLLVGFIGCVSTRGVTSGILGLISIPALFAVMYEIFRWSGPDDPREFIQQFDKYGCVNPMAPGSKKIAGSASLILMHHIDKLRKEKASIAAKNIDANIKAGFKLLEELTRPEPPRNVEADVKAGMKLLEKLARPAKPVQNVKADIAAGMQLLENLCC